MRRGRAPDPSAIARPSPRPATTTTAARPRSGCCAH